MLIKFVVFRSEQDNTHLSKPILCLRLHGPIMWKGLEVERAHFFRARVEPEFQIFSIEPILQARILILLSKPNDLYPHLSLILHQIFYQALKNLMAFIQLKMLFLGSRAQKKARTSFSNSGPGFSEPRAYLVKGKNWARTFEPEPRLVPPLDRTRIVE